MSRRCKHHWIGLPTPTSCLSRARHRGQLSLQARADPGRGLRQPAQEPPPGAAPPRRRDSCAAKRSGRAGGDRPSFHRGRPRRPRHRMVGQGGRPGAAPLGVPGGDRPSRQGDRDGGQGGRSAAGGRRLGAPSQRLTQLHVAYGNALYRGARLWRAGNDGSLRQSPRVGVWRQGRARTAGGRLRPMGRQLRARRVVGDEGARGGLPQRRRGETRFARGRRRAPRRRDHPLVRRRISRSAGSSGTRARPVPTRARRRSGVSLRTWTRASRQWSISRSHCGRWATSIARFPSFATLRRGSRASPISARVAYGKRHAAMFELMRGDLSRAAPNAFELARLTREHDLPMWRAFGVFLEGLARCCKAARPAAGSRTCVAASNFCANRTFCSSTGYQDCAGRGRSPGGRCRPRRRDPRRSAGDMRADRLSRVRSGTASRRAAKCCSSATPPIPRPRKKRS